MAPAGEITAHVSLDTSEAERQLEEFGTLLIARPNRLAWVTAIGIWINLALTAYLVVR